MKGIFSHFRQTQMNAANAAVARQEALFGAYLDRLAGRPAPGERHVTMLARSPLSPVARALVAKTDALKARGVVVQAILAQIEPREALVEVIEAVTALSPGRPLGELVRWANRSCILDAHEQLILGTTMCWSGDMMRREPGKRDGLDLFEEEAPQTVRLGALAFSAIWSITGPVPASRLRHGGVPQQGAAYAAMPSPELPRAAVLHGGGQPPLLRH